MKLNLAAGNRIMPCEDGWTNHDRWKHRDEITSTHDLEEMPWPWPDDSFETILAFDILEHVSRPVKFMEELWRVAQDGASVVVHTCWAGPSPEARQVWEDPTHIRPFHENSLRYFDPKNGGHLFRHYGKFYTWARFEHMKIQLEPPYNITFELKALK